MATYRSGLEKRLGEGRLRNMQYEPFKLNYIMEKQYLPDFVNEKKKVIFEVKGYFRTSAEASKYIAVQNYNPDWDFVFIFSDPDKPLPWAKRRKGDGAKMTHAEWAVKNGFKYCSPDTIKKEWL